MSRQALWPMADASQLFPTPVGPVRISDEGTAAELLEEGPVETSRRLVIDILDDGLMAKLGISKSGDEALVAAMGDLPIDQEAEPFGMGQPADLAGGLDLGEGLGHAGQSEVVELLEGGVRAA